MNKNNIVIKLFNYNVHFIKKNNGIVVSIYYIGIPNCKLVFGIIYKNKKLQLLVIKDGKWNIINTKSMTSLDNNSIIKFFVSVMKKFPIPKIKKPYSYLHLLFGENILLSSIIYDMIMNKPFYWLPKADEYVRLDEYGYNNLSIYTNGEYIRSGSLRIPNNEIELKKWKIRESFTDIINKSPYLFPLHSVL